MQHAIERAVIMTESTTLDHSDFILTTQVRKSEDAEFDTYKLDEVEKKIIIKVLKQNQGNITQAARELGLTRTSLYRRMEKYEL